MRRLDRQRARLTAAWCMVVLGVAATPIGIWITDEPVVLVVLSGAALVFEGIIALLVVTGGNGSSS